MSGKAGMVWPAFLKVAVSQLSYMLFQEGAKRFSGRVLEEP